MPSPGSERLNIFPAATRDDWLRAATAALKGKPLDILTTRTPEGLAIAPLRERVADAAPLTPGGRWIASARVDHPDPDAAARQALDDLEGGANGLTLVFEGAPSARGFGLPVADQAALDRALRGVELDLIHVRLDHNSGARANAAAFAALVKSRRLDPAAMKVDFGFSPIATLAACGAFSAPWPEIAGALGGQVNGLRALGFKGPFLAADARVWHEAGAGEAQELGAALATAMAYVRLLEAAGAALEQAFAEVSFVVAVDDNQWMSIAKLRALRLLWDAAQSACGVAATPATVHAETSFRMLARRDVATNILRNSIAAFSAVVAGADSLVVLPFTSALGLPAAHARRVARNTQALLEHETHVWRAGDPAAGAGALEALSDDLAQAAWKIFQSFEARGGDMPGIVAATVDGSFAAEIAGVAAVRAAAFAEQRMALTGVNSFPDLGEAKAVVEAAAPKRDKRLTGPVAAEPLPRARLSEPFERLRDRAEAIAAKTGAAPVVFLANIGAVSDFGARAAFAKSFFETGGITAPDNDGFVDGAGVFQPGAMVAAFARSGARLVCVCASDAALSRSASEASGPNDTLLARALAALRRAGAARIHVAGRPEPMNAAPAPDLRFIHVGANALVLLEEALDVADA